MSSAGLQCRTIQVTGLGLATPGPPSIGFLSGGYAGEFVGLIGKASNKMVETGASLLLPFIKTKNKRSLSVVIIGIQSERVRREMSVFRGVSNISTEVY